MEKKTTTKTDESEINDFPQPNKTELKRYYNGSASFCRQGHTPKNIRSRMENNHDQ